MARESTMPIRVRPATRKKLRKFTMIFNSGINPDTYDQKINCLIWFFEETQKGNNLDALLSP